MNNLYEVLETCLQEIEQGADIDTVLFRYPDLADELRPILEASRNASGMVVPAPSAEVLRRNRAKVLQRAAEMREATVRQTSRRFWFVSFRRLVVTLAVVSILFVSGTGLVSASSTTLPGDRLYPVKRTWEDMLVLFTFDSRQRDALVIEHENERLHELQELFSAGRFADVEFAGLVTRQSGNEWTVGGIPVVISPQTKLRGQDIVVGSAVRVEGHTQDNGAVLAEEVKLLPPDAKLPDVEEEQEHEEESGGTQNQPLQIEKDLGEAGSPKVEESESDGSGPEQEEVPLNESDQGDVSESDDHKDNKSDSGSKNDGNHQDDGDDDHHDSNDDSEDGDSERGDSSSGEDDD